MTTIQVHIDEVPTKPGHDGIELAGREDPDANGISYYSVDVEIEDDGNWDITAVYPVTNPIASTRGKKMAGLHAIKTAAFLDDFAFFQISDAVKNETGRPATKMAHAARV